MRLLFAFLLFVGCYTATAQKTINLSGGFGYGIVGNHAEYSTGNTYLAGVSASITGRVLTGGIGLRFWNTQYSYTSRLFDEVKRPIGTVALDGSANIITIPLQAGFDVNYRKIHFAGVGLGGISLYNNPEITSDSKRLATLINSGSFDPGTNGAYFTGGLEFSIGYQISDMVSLDMRYSYITFLQGLDNTKVNPYIEPAKDEKPTLNAIGLYVNVRF